MAFWAAQAFDLAVPEHLGNCTWCWKKSLRKHLTLAKEHPEVFDFPARMEAKYANAGSGNGARVFFRQRMRVADIFERATQPFAPFVDTRAAASAPAPYAPDMDSPDGCSESCEVYPED